MDPTFIITVLTGLGLLGGIGLGIRAVLERRTIRSKANIDNANATAVVVAAARELVDPLRQELAQERAEHAREMEEERIKVAHLRKELDAVATQLAAALADVQTLRADLNIVRTELAQALAEVEVSNARSRALEEENLRLRSLMREHGELPPPTAV